MVRGLELFKNYFKGYQDQYVLIGGSATYLNLSDQNIRFRGTKEYYLNQFKKIFT